VRLEIGSRRKRSSPRLHHSSSAFGLHFHVNADIDTNTVTYILYMNLRFPVIPAMETDCVHTTCLEFADLDS
jgi:hypothetical protein